MEPGGGGEQHRPMADEARRCAEVTGGSFARSASRIHPRQTYQSEKRSRLFKRPDGTAARWEKRTSKRAGQNDDTRINAPYPAWDEGGPQTKIGPEGQRSVLSGLAILDSVSSVERAVLQRCTYLKRACPNRAYTNCDCKNPNHRDMISLMIRVVGG